MTTTMTTLIERAAALLMDGDQRVWPEAALSEALRLALGEYNLARAADGLDPAALAGLDGAPETTLNAAHDSLLALGAAGYAAAARAVQRAESYELDRDASGMAAWSANRLEEFRAMLRTLHPAYTPGAAQSAAERAAEAARLAGLRQSLAPWAVWPFEE